MKHLLLLTKALGNLLCLLSVHMLWLFVDVKSIGLLCLHMQVTQTCSWMSMFILHNNVWNFTSCQPLRVV